MPGEDQVNTAERAVCYGVVAGLVVSQANSALFDDLVHRQSSFDAVGWANWFLYLFVPILAGGWLLHYGRTAPDDPARAPERAIAASIAGLLVASVALRIAVPIILHQGDVIPDRVPRTVSDGFSFVAEYARLAPLAGQGHSYDLGAAVVCSAVMAAAIAFGALAFERRLVPLLGSTVVGAIWAVVGWYVPGGAGVRIIGSVWPVLVIGSIGLVLGLEASAVRRRR